MDLLEQFNRPAFGAPGAQYGISSASSKTDDVGQGRQLHPLRPLTLMQFSGISEGGVSGSVSFRITVPDSRLRVNIAIIGVPTAGAAANFIGTKGLTLWLRAVEDSLDTGTVVPITNLWGTSATPDPIPGYIDPTTGLAVNDPNLGGWGKEFVTSGNAIEGTVTYSPGVNTGAGLLVLQVRYIPEAIRFPREEWDEIRKACDRSLYGQPLTGGA